MTELDVRHARATRRGSGERGQMLAALLTHHQVQVLRLPLSQHGEAHVHEPVASMNAPL
ncbi:MAG: hypothetical protein R3B40_18620 [Polyangiales bacterium]|nr:hypothetical protein [Sandaracinaceae bacterium]